tara:strand:- start:122 stop:868 length:747 start_codon:yes stop_codon:yes gene_type:complete
MKPVGKGKLSKRDGEKLGFPVFPLSWKESLGYKEKGYFPEAVINFLALLGWNPGTEQEVFSLEELVELFTLERVQKSGARFDPDKTKWYNQHYLQEKHGLALVPAFQELLAKHHVLNQDEQHLEKIISLIKERATFVADFWELSNYFFIHPTFYEEKAIKKQWKDDSSEIMNNLLPILNAMEDFSYLAIEKIVKDWITSQGYSFGKVMPPLRLVIVGDMKGPHIFDIIALIGKEATIQRIKTAVTVLP